MPQPRPHPVPEPVPEPVPQPVPEPPPDPDDPLPEPAPSPLNNAMVARRLGELADLLEAQGAGVFRVRAYRDASNVVRSLDRPAHEVVAAEGAVALTGLPKIGQSLARTIAQLALTGTCPLLGRLRGVANPERVLATVPGLGGALAARIHERLGIEALADLEAAAWDGRLARLPGIGPRRIRAVRQSLAGRFGAQQSWWKQMSRGKERQAPVSELLSVDNEYRRKAAADRLQRIAPHRFNPTRSAWLPILHATRGPRHYTALYSNTGRAHQLGTTHDWVVIYRDDDDGHGQWTVTTARQGSMRGKRVVRGREDECAGNYASAASDRRTTQVPQPRVIEERTRAATTSAAAPAR